jgi:tail tube GTA-gp10-like protein
MARNATFRTFYGDAEHDFRLGLGELDELEQLTGMGSGEIWADLQISVFHQLGKLHVMRTRTVLRLGLVGGGMPKMEAAAHVDRHFVPPDLFEGGQIAFRALGAALVGCEDDPEPAPGEPGGEGTPAAPASPTDEQTGG